MDTSRDNHAGPNFQALQVMFPKATRFHWSVNAFNAAFNHWLVGTPNQCGGGSGMFWLDVSPSEIKGAD